MPSSIPRSVREAWGDEATEDFERWLEQTLRERAVPRDEYREVLSRLDVLEHDMAGLKDEVGALRREMNERFDRVNERFDQMYERMLVMMRWTVGTIALFGTLITVLLAIAEFA